MYYLKCKELNFVTIMPENSTQIEHWQTYVSVNLRNKSKFQFVSTKSKARN